MRAIVHFIDGNKVWFDCGELRPGAHGFVLELPASQGGGTRVFPLLGSQAFAYSLEPDADDELIVRTNDNEVLIDRTGFDPSRG